MTDFVEILTKIAIYSVFFLNFLRRSYFAHDFLFTKCSLRYLLIKDEKNMLMERLLHSLHNLHNERRSLKNKNPIVIQGNINYATYYNFWKLFNCFFVYKYVCKYIHTDFKTYYFINSLYKSKKSRARVTTGFFLIIHVHRDSTVA